MEKYRALTADEIAALTSSGNRCSDWERVVVAPDFAPANISGCTFSGAVRIGAVRGEVVSSAGLNREAALRNTEFIDCDIAEGVYVANTGSYIAGYDIETGAYIEGNGTIAVAGECAFGVGVRVAGVNEGGGREVPLSERLSSQIAYITALYRHRPRMIEKICVMTAPEPSERGVIGAGAKIEGCGSVTGVNIGPGAVLCGAAELGNGTVGSSPEAPSYVGTGVIAKDFIMAEGATVGSAAQIERCFVGEGVRIEGGFSAVDSLFFACSHMAAGEACSILAGPFTVSHHRSSLLIAGVFSFFNAGSGSNQSNHLFKTGAVHQGIHERGCKFASNAYVMLPAREGAFTMVLGRHTSHHDTKDFPFSYLIEDEGKSFLMPGANLRSYGTFRDMAKWPVRDKRRGPRRDQINFESYSPYLGERVARAVAKSEALLEQKIDVYSHERIRIRQSMLRRGLDLYRKALKATLSYILSGPFEADPLGDDSWVDVGGMFAPQGVVERLCADIEQGAVGSMDELLEHFAAIRSRYGAYARGWALARLREQIGREPGDEDIKLCIADGVVEIEALERMAEEDGARDGADLMMTGYGVDSTTDCNTVADDFIAVRERK